MEECRGDISDRKPPAHGWTDLSYPAPCCQIRPVSAKCSIIILINICVDLNKRKYGCRGNGRSYYRAGKRKSRLRSPGFFPD